MSTKRRIHEICSRIADTSFSVRYWDGDLKTYGDASPEFTLILKDKSVVEGIFTNVALRFPEAYVDGAIEVEGDLQRLIRLVFLVDGALLRSNLSERAMLTLMSLKQRNTVRQSRTNVSRHYDLGNDFFKLWLDPSLVYSCAYFEGSDDTIEVAQIRKLDYICNKLRLAPGERLLDIGCGWGALAIHAARTRRVRVLGITLSEEQRKEAAARVAAAGLSESVEIRLQDYRVISEQATFDKIVSVGMLEHVGRENIGECLRRMSLLLKPKGIGLLQSIGRMVQGPVNPWILKHIFPGMYLPSLAEITDHMGQHDLNVIDVENLRIHYAYTLDRWAAAFESSAEAICHMFDATFVRMWRMYLNSSAATFRYGYLNLWQITFTNGLVNDSPLTREHHHAVHSSNSNLLPLMNSAIDSKHAS